MTLISCEYMRLDTDLPKKDALLGAIVCTHPAAHGYYCLINWQNEICPREEEFAYECLCVNAALQTHPCQNERDVLFLSYVLYNIDGARYLQ